MAIIKFCNKKCVTSKGLKNTIQYVLDDKKTEDKYCYGFSVGVGVDKTFNDMMMLKKAFNKLDKRQCVHFVVSFYDVFDKDKAIEIGMKLAQYYTNDYQVLMALHTNTEHLHLHYILNTVNITIGKKYRQNSKELAEFKRYANKTFNEYNIKPIEKAEFFNETEGEYHTKKRGETPWKDIVRADIKNALKCTTNRLDFIQKMHNLGYIVKWTSERKSITFTTPHGKNIRDNKLGYSKEKFEQIFKNNEIYERQTSFTSFLKDVLPDKGNFIDFPTGIIPPEVDQLSKNEQIRVLGEFWNSIKSQQVKAISQNEDEAERQKEQQAFDNLMDWVYDAYYQIERQINIEKPETRDDEWDMDM
jgi:hypothetical protein